MDKIEILSPLTLVQDEATGPKRARVKLPNGNEVTVLVRREDGFVHAVGELLKVVSAKRPLTKESFSRYQYTSSKDGHKFDKWHLKGCQLKLNLEPISATAAVLLSAEVADIAEDIDDATAALLGSIAVSPAKKQVAAAPAAVDASLVD